MDWLGQNYFLLPEHSQANSQSLQGHTYLLAPDSPTYVYFSGWRNPWLAHRSLGYPAFLYPFLYQERQKFVQDYAEAYKKAGDALYAGTIYDLATETGIATRFEAIALAQRLLLALGISVFYFSLCRWFPTLFSFAALLAALWLAPPADPRYILTEPLSSALTWVCGACLLFAPMSRRQGLCFALACLCASLAYLVRPQALSLTGLCSLVFLFQLWRRGRKGGPVALARVSLAFSPLLLACAYIGWMSVTGGQLFFHTHPSFNKSLFCFFAETEDAAHMPTSRAKKFTAWYGAHKDELIRKMKNGEYFQVELADDTSPVRKRAVIGDVLIYSGPFLQAWWKHLGEKGRGPWSRLEEHIFGRELSAGLRPRHLGEMVASSWQNFLGGLGWYEDVYFLGSWPRATFAINATALAFTALALAVCSWSRWPLVMMAGIHVMALLAATLGHFVLGRYVVPTEPLLLLAGICSLRVLAGMLSGLKGSRPLPAWGEGPGERQSSVG